VIGNIRENVAFYEKDRFFADDIAAMKAWVSDCKAPETVTTLLPSHRAATV
jgi:histidine ammonia-lyase